MDDVAQLSLGELGTALREGRLTATALAERALARRRLEAYVHVDETATLWAAADADAALAQGRDEGPLHGIPVSVKDLFGVPGHPTFAGSARRLPPRFEEAGPVVESLLLQRAVVVGKTHTVEFAFGGLGLNPHHATPVNPWDADDRRAPGGSSAGAGVSLCEGSAMLALGTDTAGSVRIPAAWTGNVALKPTAGRWSRAGIVPLSRTLDTPGLLARTVEDLALAAGAVDQTLDQLPAPPSAASVRAARVDALVTEGCSPGVVEAFEEGLAELGRAGLRVEAAELPEVNEAWDLFRIGGPVSVELHHFLESALPGWLETLDPNVRRRVGDAGALSAHEYLGRVDAIATISRSAAERARQHDVLLWPTVANTPPRLDEIADAEGYARENVLCLRNTALVSYLGLCAVTLPVGLDDAGMPTGLQLVCAPGREASLLAVAACFESVLGTSRQRLGTPPRLA